MSITKVFIIASLIFNASCTFLKRTPGDTNNPAPTPNQPPPNATRPTPPVTIPKKMMVFVFGDDIIGRGKTVQGVVNHLRDIKRHVGDKGAYGEVGLAIAYPYTAFLEGKAGQWTVPPIMRIRFLNIMKALQLEGMQLMLGLNGSIWASGSGPYNDHWKTIDGGKYLMKYADNRFNASVVDNGRVSSGTLSKYATLTPYKDKQNVLYLTNSQHYGEFVDSRRQALFVTLSMFRDLDAQVPGVLTHFTTDSEVCNFSFRKSGGKVVQLGYEASQVSEFCQGRTKPCPTISKEWRDYRAMQHKAFIQVTVDEIRRHFPTQTIYTHQYPVSNQAILTGGGIDMGSPLWSAIVDNAYPGYTIYAFGGRWTNELLLMTEISQQVPNSPWGATEFNPARGWSASAGSKAKATKEFLKELYKRNCRTIAPLSWTSNSLDTGIKGSGVDAGIKQFINEGP